MTRNIAIGCNGSGSSYGSGRTTRSLTSSNSNVSSTWSANHAYSLNAEDETTGCTTSSTRDCDSYTTPRMKCSAAYGAWYNYKAATAGTITGSSNSTNATYDVCPKGWRLPTYSENVGVSSYSSRFNPVTGGVYQYGSNQYTSHGIWWSSTVANSSDRYGMRYNNGLWAGNDNFHRTRGYYVRCVKS